MKKNEPRFDIPSHLKAKTQEWCKGVVDDYEIEEHQFRILINAGEAWDRKEQAREALDEYGLTYMDRFDAPRTRPEVAIEHNSSIRFARCIRELGLPIGDPEQPRGPRVGGKQ